MKKVIKYNSDKHWIFHCKCGWIDSSENLNGGYAIADTGDYSDVYCPKCGNIDPEEHELSILYKGEQILEIEVNIDEIDKIYEDRLRSESDYLNRLINGLNSD